MVGVSLKYTIQPPARQRVVGLEAAIAAQPEAIGDLEYEAKYVDHHFAPGMYGRVCTLPKNECVVGKIHIHSHLNVLISGRVKVVTEFGEELLTAPKVWTSEAGTKRAVYALEDSLWMTVHHNPSDEQDIRAIEAAVIAPDFETFDRLQLESGDTP
jgi:hypothetical protein